MTLMHQVKLEIILLAAIVTIYKEHIQMTSYCIINNNKSQKIKIDTITKMYLIKLKLYYIMSHLPPIIILKETSR